MHNIYYLKVHELEVKDLEVKEPEVLNKKLKLKKIWKSNPIVILESMVDIWMADTSGAGVLVK